jgi:hypothetical protein
MYPGFTAGSTLPRLPGSSNRDFREIYERNAAFALFLIGYGKVIVWRSMALQGEIRVIQIFQLKKEREKKSGDYGNC